MSRPPARLLVLGIDAASAVLVRRWAEDGTLPHLRALMTRGCFGQTRGVDGFFVGATWPTFYTGVTPARHGLHYQVQLERGTYEFRSLAAGPLTRREPFWDHLSRAGRRVAILDVPLTQLRSPLNGIQVIEWSGHDALYGFRTSPPELADRLRSRFGMPPLGPSCDADARSPADYQRFVEALIAGVELKTELTLDLLKEGDWDFFMQVFTETHCAGHQSWHLHDASHPAHDPGITALTGDPLRRVYAAVDRAVGRILDEAGAARVFVLSAHGMSHWYGAQFLLAEILERLGVTRPSTSPGAAQDDGAAVLAPARWAWRRLPEPFRRCLGPLRDRVLGATGPSLPSLRVDPARSSCFSVPNGMGVGAIRLNLIGREPQGTLRPGAQADAFDARLGEALLEIVDERSGGPLVRRVIRTRDVYPGPHLDDLPDLLVEWNDAVPTGSTRIAGGAGATVRARSPRIGSVEGANAYGRTGEHRPGGWFLAAGPGIRAGRLEQPASILDFAPSFARILDAERPECDGRVLDELWLGR